jgi:hypothetical protein
MTGGTERRDPVSDALARGPYLDDDGFTERVMARLPPRRWRARAPLLVAAALAAGAAGSAALLGPGAPLLAALAAWAGGGGAFPVAALCALAALGASGALVAFAD